MKINNLTKFLIYFAILLIFNFVVLLNINQFYIRQVLSSLILFTLPGYLLLQAFRFHNKSIGENVLFSIGISLSCLMVLGWLINIILPFLGIPKPLTLNNLLIGVDALIILSLISNLKAQKSFLNIKFPSIKLGELILYITPVILLVLSILGAIQLNNKGPNTITFYMLLVTAVYMGALCIFGDKLKSHFFAYTLYFISLSLLLMLSLRSNYLIGWDINGEYNVFQLTKNAGIWDVSKYQNAYYACLSITILPTLIGLITAIPDIYIFKILYQLFFALVPVVIYQTSKKYLNNAMSFLSVIYIIMQPFFIQPMTGLMRQEIAFLFFTLLLLTLFSFNLSVRFKKAMFIIFGFSMVVSHYSTTYVSLILFFLTYLIVKSLLIANNTKFAKKISNLTKKSVINNRKIYLFLNIRLIVILILFSFFWYAQINNISKDIRRVVVDAIMNMNSLFKDELKSTEAIKALSLFDDNKINYNQVIDNYVKESKEKNFTYEKDLYPSETYNTYVPKIINSESVKSNFPTTLSRHVYTLQNILKQLTKLFVLLGTFVILVKFYNKNLIDREMIIMIAISTLVITFMLIHPTISVNYNLSRLYLQTLFVQHIAALFGALSIFSFFPEKLKKMSVTIIYIVVFLISSGFTSQVFGGYALLHLNNFGEDYDKFNFTTHEIKSLEWLKFNRDTGYPVYADNVSSIRTQFVLQLYPITNILPQFIQRESYVYARTANILRLRSDLSFSGKSFSYEYPLEFLNNNKNVVYNNSLSTIYK